MLWALIMDGRAEDDRRKVERLLLAAPVRESRMALAARMGAEITLVG